MLDHSPHTASLPELSAYARRTAMGTRESIISAALVTSPSDLCQRIIATKIDI